MTAETMPLADWTAAAWERHNDEPQAVADALLARAAALGGEADAAEALRLAQHVMLAHRADAAALRRFVEALPSTAALQAGLAQARFALEALQAAPGPVPASPGLPLADRWRALHDVALAWAHHGQAARAQAWLLAEEPIAAACDDAAARRAYAVAAHNIALGLRLAPRRDAAADALMLAAAERALGAWARAGTWLQVERAHYQWAQCLAVLGRGAEALVQARACLHLCEAEGADAFERFWAHEAMARAALAAGDTALREAQGVAMRAALATVEDAALAAWCRSGLAALDAAIAAA